MNILQGFCWVVALIMLVVTVAAFVLALIMSGREVSILLDCIVMAAAFCVMTAIGFADLLVPKGVGHE